MTLVFLQNAWSPLYAGNAWPRPSWLRALERSRSGQRLKLLIDDFDVCENTTPKVSAVSSGIEVPDADHIKAIIAARQPKVIIACGKQAEKALSELWDGALLCVPHPANRVLTNQLYVEARTLLASEFNQRIALRQLRGSVITETLQ